MSTQVESPTSNDDGGASVWAQRCSVLHKAWVQVRYHRRRQRFFDLADKLTKSATVVLGASLMGQYFRDILPWMATAITSLGLLALVFGYGDRKQLHKELAELAANLVASIELVPAGELTPAKTAGWASEFARICAKAPPALKTLTMMCEREQASADGNPDHVPLQRFHRRLLADLW